MIKKYSFKRLYKLLIILLIVLLLKIFPGKETYSLNIKRTMNNKIYHDIFLKDKNNYIAKTKIAVNSINKKRLSKELITCLIKNSTCQDKVPNGFSQILPIKTKINNINIENEIVKIDFSNLFYEIDTNEEEKVIESIIYTLTSIQDIKAVSIYIDGKELNELPISKKHIDSVLTRSYGINKETNINSLKNISFINVYYVNKSDNDIYYIPVSKYINSDNNKINIIIEELSSRSTYNSNLMSYLNTNAKLIDFNEKDDFIYLNFNDALFNNKIKETVLEEVLYSISYSIEDTIDVKNVTFLVNNKEIKR